MKLWNLTPKLETPASSRVVYVINYALTKVARPESIKAQATTTRVRDVLSLFVSPIPKGAFKVELVFNLEDFH